MHAGNGTNGHPSAEADTDPAAIRDQLGRILASPSFRNSKRYSGFLRFVVEEKLTGHASEVKERSVGVNVFGREQDYDTNADPVVRVSAGEIRKRLAQYYHEPGREGELRIELPAGAYVPEFRPGNPPTAAPATPAPAAEPAPRRRRTVFLAAGIAAIAAAIWFFVAWSKPADPFERFWQPLWDSPGTVVVSMAGRRFPDASGRPAPLQTAMNDAIALARLAPVLERNGRRFRVLDQASTTQAVLKQGPVVLIGAFSNDLTLRLMREARFTFDRDSAGPWIRDRQNPSKKEWQLDTSGASRGTGFKDYAIAARVLDPTTDRMAVVAAGITSRGTLATAEFLSRRESMRAIADLDSDLWSNSNVQIVLEINILPDKAPVSRVVATYFW